jgi:uncharacterized membrane protein
MQSVPAGRGWIWVVAAFGLFRKNPLIWVALNLVLLLIGAGLTMLPVIGTYVLYLLTPTFLAGVIAAAHDLESGKDIEIAHLFRGFRQNAAQLVTVGGVYLVGQVLISGVMLAIGGPEFQEMAAKGMAGVDPTQITPEALSRISMAMLVGAALFMPLAMATWFAPALVLLGNQPGFRAVVFSMMACLRNILTFLIYGILTFALLVVAVIPFGLGLILWIPVMLLTMYTSYRDVFTAPAESTAPAAAD